jgi:hypothetical protein
VLRRSAIFSRASVSPERISGRRRFVVLVLRVVFLLVRIGGDEAVEADDRADGAQPAVRAPLDASISTVVRSISAGCIWLAMARFQIIS